MTIWINGRSYEHMTTIILCFPIVSDHGVDSRISEHYARAPLHMVVDANGQKMALLDASHCRVGDGRFPAQAMKELGVGEVVCATMGREAQAHLQRLGIHTSVCTARTVAEALEEFRTGSLVEVNEEILLAHDQDPRRHIGRRLRQDGSGQGLGLGRGYEGGFRGQGLGLGRGGRGRCRSLAMQNAALPTDSAPMAENENPTDAGAPATQPQAYTPNAIDSAPFQPGMRMGRGPCGGGMGRAMGGAGFGGRGAGFGGGAGMGRRGMGNGQAPERGMGLGNTDNNPNGSPNDAQAPNRYENGFGGRGAGRGMGGGRGMGRGRRQGGFGA